MTSQFKNTEIVDTGFLRLPRGATNERPSSPEAGQIRFNTDLGKPEWYEPEYGAWLTTDRQPPVIASGGDTVEDIDVDGVTYRVHSFTTVGSNNFTVTRGGSVEYLIVAGGGGGGSSSNATSGGGGAGGLLQDIISIGTGTYPIYVGAGGADSQPGDRSSALGIQCIGGGNGGCANSGNAQPSPGGSGGGGGNGGDFSNSGSPGTPGQGHLGGDSVGSDNRGGGGGGAGQPGFDSPGDASGGAGGSGSASYITGSFQFYGGGGGGASGTGGVNVGGAGGLGGGGKGESNNTGDATAGASNTGGGGGGAFVSGGQPGGSGIVVIRYPIS